MNTYLYQKDALLQKQASSVVFTFVLLYFSFSLCATFSKYSSVHAESSLEWPAYDRSCALQTS